MSYLFKWTSYESKFMNNEFKSTSYLPAQMYELWVQIQELRVEIQVLPIQIHELPAQIHELQAQIYKWKI